MDEKPTEPLADAQQARLRLLNGESRPEAGSMGRETQEKRSKRKKNKGIPRPAEPKTRPRHTKRRLETPPDTQNYPFCPARTAIRPVSRL